MQDPFTPGLDLGPRTPGLDSNPVRKTPDEEMEDFIKETFRENTSRRTAERGNPKTYQPVTSTFTSAPISTLNSEPPLGRRTSIKAQEITGTAMAAAGAFYSMRTVASGADAGDIYLQGGAVSGGTGNEIVDEILLYDLSTDTWSGGAGQHLQLEVSGAGQETSGILDPIFNVSGATVSIVTAMDANTLPSSGDVSGKSCFVSLGVFIDEGFMPAESGNIGVQFCWGGYIPSRF